jgi:hypothetical protein
MTLLEDEHRRADRHQPAQVPELTTKEGVLDHLMWPSRFFRSQNTDSLEIVLRGRRAVELWRSR